MNDNIQSNLALQIAQLALDKATAEAQRDEFKAQAKHWQERAQELEAQLLPEKEPMKGGD